MATSEAPAPVDGAVTARDKATGDLVRDLSAQVSTLVRQELELAKVELSDKGKEAGIGVGMFGGAAIMALFAVGALTAAAILALDLVLAGWLAALIVAVVWLAIAGTMALLGRAHTKKAGPPAPEQTVETIKEDVRYTKQAVQEARR